MLPGLAPSVIGGGYFNVTWNPSDKGSAVTLSNGNLTATGATSGGWANSACRATLGRGTGKYYWEMTVGGSAVVNAIHIALMNATASLTSNVWATAKSAVYYSRAGTQITYVNGITQSSTPTNVMGNSNVAQLAIDLDAGKAWLGSDGTWQASGNPAAGTNPWLTWTPPVTFFPACGLYGESPADTATLRTKPSQFSYSPPSGFLPWAAY